MKHYIKHDGLILLFLFLPLAAIPFLSPLLPDVVPIHFNIHGEPDDFGSKWIILLLTPLINLVLYLIILGVSYIDPKQKISAWKKPVPQLRFSVVLMMFSIHLLLIVNTLFTEMNMLKWILALISLFFIVLGNYMRPVQHNYFIGIRTPWTLESEKVWRETHYVTARLWFILGVLQLVIIYFAESIWILHTGYWLLLGAMIIYPVWYSWKRFNEIKKSEKVEE